MSLLKETEKLEEKVRQLIEGLFGKEAAREPLEIRRAILREIEGKIEPVSRSRKVFPFNRLRLHLFASNPHRRAIFKAAFVEEHKLEKDIVDLLRRNGAHSSPDLSIQVHVEKHTTVSGEAESQYFRVDYQ